MFRWFERRRARKAARENPEPVFRAQSDMTTDDQIRQLVRWGERVLEQGHKVLTLDLTDAVSVDSGLVAGIILLSRRARPERAALKLVGYSEQLESLMKIYKVWTPLAQSGVILQPKEHGEEEATPETMPTAVRPHDEPSSPRSASDLPRPRPAM